MHLLHIHPTASWVRALHSLWLKRGISLCVCRQLVRFQLVRFNQNWSPDS